MNLLPSSPNRPERAAIIHELTQAAFAPYAALARPSGALAESVDDVAVDLDAGGGLLAYDDEWQTPLGALRWRVGDGHLWVKRVAVHPAHQGAGVGRFLMDAAGGIAIGHGLRDIRLGVRHALHRNRDWYERLGYRPHVDHHDWTEYTAPVAPFDAARPARLVKYEYPDHVQGVHTLDVLDEDADGWWVGAPAFTSSFQGETLVWVAPRPVVGFLPRDEWWTAWWTEGPLALKVDICTPTQRTDTGDLVFRDLCLDVVVDRGRPAQLVDEDEFAEHLPGGPGAPYPPDIVAGARRSADDVLQRVVDGDSLFARTGPERLEKYVRSR